MTLSNTAFGGTKELKKETCICRKKLLREYGLLSKKFNISFSTLTKGQLQDYLSDTHHLFMKIVNLKQVRG